MRTVIDRVAGCMLALQSRRDPHVCGVGTTGLPVQEVRPRSLLLSQCYGKCQSRRVCLSSADSQGTISHSTQFPIGRAPQVVRISVLDRAVFKRRCSCRAGPCDRVCQPQQAFSCTETRTVFRPHHSALTYGADRAIAEEATKHECHAGRRAVDGGLFR